MLTKLNLFTKKRHGALSIDVNLHIYLETKTKASPTPMLNSFTHVELAISQLILRHLYDSLNRALIREIVHAN